MAGRGRKRTHSVRQLDEDPLQSRGKPVRRGRRDVVCSLLRYHALEILEDPTLGFRRIRDNIGKPEVGKEWGDARDALRETPAK